MHNSMRKKLIFLCVIVGTLIMQTSLLEAKVINYELRFTPYIGDVAKSDHVKLVAGQVQVSVNNIPMFKQDVREKEGQVLFEERSIAPSGISLSLSAAGPLVRKGQNTLRVEFTPLKSGVTYMGQLEWAQVTDNVFEKQKGQRVSTTNQSQEGKEVKAASGKLVMEHRFDAPFATAQWWHDKPAITILTEEDKKQLMETVKKWAEAFKPGFEPLYTFLREATSVNVEKIKELQCFDKAYGVGIRVNGPSSVEQLELITTGNPEVVITSKNNKLFSPVVPALSKEQKRDEALSCANMILPIVYRPQLIVVRMGAREWKVIY